MKKIIIYILSAVIITLTGMPILVNAKGDSQERKELQIKGRGKGVFEVTSGKRYSYDGTKFSDDPEEITWGDELVVNEKGAVKIANIIFKKLYGIEFIKDRACFLKDDKDKNVFVVSRRYKEQGLDGPWCSVSIDKKHGTILKIWSHDNANITDKLDIDARMALDIADSLFTQSIDAEKFFVENNYFFVSEIENSNIIVVGRWNIDEDGGDIWLAIDRKNGTTIKRWCGE